ncbi:ABC transporter ATP-binding protein [archaeon]|jgi:putative ABC transport system ATP-binding protein|nr:ABC transporter ATP-binding protein [archaeon]MBT6698556.1 ABC transporter ATP-binding protein [archaeon]
MVDSHSKVLYSLKNIVRSFDLGAVQVHVLKGIDLSIKRGEFVAITGSSGSGKSTLMNLLGMLDVPTSGSILFEGEDVSGLSDDELAVIRGKRVGFIFQQFNLLGTLSAEENVALPLMFQGVPSEDRLTKARELLQLVGLGDRMHHKPNELSGGQQQRVAIARALVNDPDVILADEPTGNLDSHTGQEVMQMLEKFNKDGRTVLLITHDQNLVKYAKRKIFLHDGVVTRDGK